MCKKRLKENKVEKVKRFYFVEKRLQFDNFCLHIYEKLPSEKRGA